eukprot:scaffold520796_cov23-Prasinocladus_malaysianus.AAC.1
MDMLSSDSAPRSSIGWLCGVQGAPGAVCCGVACHHQRNKTSKNMLITPNILNTVSFKVLQIRVQSLMSCPAVLRAYHGEVISRTLGVHRGYVHQANPANAKESLFLIQVDATSNASAM